MTGIKPLVFKRGGKKRLGKGFSINELKAAGITVKEAHKHSIPIDPRRKTAHEENIKTLKEILKTSEKPEKPSGKKGTRKSKNEKGQ